MDALLDAIEDKLPDKVEEIVDSGTVNINECDADGYTPLILGCTVGHHDIVDYLITSKAKIDFTAPDGASALFCAVQEGHWEVVELLIDSDADVNLQSQGGATPLYIAAQEGFKSLVHKLLDHGAKPNVRAHGVSPLFIACQERHVSCVKELIKGKADPNQKNKSGGLPLIVSCFKGHVPVVRELISTSDVDPNKCAAGISALMTAAKMKHSAVIKELVKHPDIQVNLKSKNQERNTAGHFAATAGSAEVLDVLKECGVDLAIENSSGHTPADVIKAKHSIKYNGPKGSGATLRGADGAETKGDDSPSKESKRSKKSKKSKRSKKDLKKRMTSNADVKELADAVFKKYDMNEDGLLNTPEFLRCLVELGFKNLFPGDQFKHKVRECFQQFDKDGSGGIDRKEFYTFHNWLKEEHGMVASVDASGALNTSKEKPKIKKQKTSKHEAEAEAAGRDAHVDYYILNRDSKVDFGLNFKVKNFGPKAPKQHHLLKKDTEYLVVRNCRNLPDGSLGPAAMQGIEEDDIILFVDKKPVRSFAEYASRSKGKDEIHISILRLPVAGSGLRRKASTLSGGWGLKAHGASYAATAFHANPLASRSADGGFLPSIGR